MEQGEPLAMIANVASIETQAVDQTPQGDITVLANYSAPPDLRRRFLIHIPHSFFYLNVNFRDVKTAFFLSQFVQLIQP